jgi:protein-S-isoprenylcysteine O-methyltransferase Ste14
MANPMVTTQRSGGQPEGGGKGTLAPEAVGREPLAADATAGGGAGRASWGGARAVKLFGIATTRWTRLAANLVGAGGAAYFAAITLQGYLATHRLLGVGFFCDQMIVGGAYLVRRPARVVTRRPRDWLLAFGGTFTAVLLRPTGIHAGWGNTAGVALQVVGLVVCVSSFLVLGRSFGFAAADRGLVTRGPYAVVRHPIYAGYVLSQLGYVLQSISLANIAVFLFASAFNVGRSLVEDDVLTTNPDHRVYRTRVRWRMVPGIW